MEFLPNPKQMEYHTGHFLPGSQTKIVLCGTEPGAFLYAQMLQKELKEEAGLSLDILRALCPAESGDIVLCLDQKLEKITISWPLRRIRSLWWQAATRRSATAYRPSAR